MSHTTRGGKKAATDSGTDRDGNDHLITTPAFEVEAGVSDLAIRGGEDDFRAETAVEWWHWHEESTICISTTGGLPRGLGGGQYSFSLMLAPETAIALGERLVDRGEEALGHE